MPTNDQKPTTPPPSQDKPPRRDRPGEFIRKDEPTPITYFKPGQLPTKPAQGGGKSGGESGGSKK